MTDIEKIALIKSECQRLIRQTQYGPPDWNEGCAWGRRLVAGYIIDLIDGKQTVIRPDDYDKTRMVPETIDIQYEEKPDYRLL